MWVKNKTSTSEIPGKRGDPNVSPPPPRRDSGVGGSARGLFVVSELRRHTRIFLCLKRSRRARRGEARGRAWSPRNRKRWRETEKREKNRGGGTRGGRELFPPEPASFSVAYARGNGGKKPEQGGFVLIFEFFGHFPGEAVPAEVAVGGGPLVQGPLQVQVPATQRGAGHKRGVRPWSPRPCCPLPIPGGRFWSFSPTPEIPEKLQSDTHPHPRPKALYPPAFSCSSRGRFQSHRAVTVGWGPPNAATAPGVPPSVCASPPHPVT